MVAQPSQTAAPAEPTAPVRHTALECFVALARHHGVDLSVPRLVHEYALAAEPTDRIFQRVIAENGFKAKRHKVVFADLPKLQGVWPALAQRRDGSWVVVSGYKGEDGTGEIAVLDPRAEKPGFQFFNEAAFADYAEPFLLLVRRSVEVTDPDQPFSLLWFVPELLRQRGVFRDVALAAVMLTLIGLATPIYFQLVIDKVLVHQGITTLWMLTGGIMAALLFESVFSFLRRFLLLFATNRIDIRLATRTFGHMLRLPIDFFERASAGVIVKHMQQAEKIRQFLTGRLFLTLLDSAGLIIFLPILFLYSPTLTFIVLGFACMIALVIALLVGPFRRRLKQLYEAEGARQALLVEAIHGMRTVKSLALEPRQRQVWDERSAAAVLANFRVGQVSALAQALTQLLERVLNVAVISVGAFAVFDNELTVGALVAFNMLSNRVSGPLVQLVGLVNEYQETALSVRMLGEIMNRRPERAGGRGLRPNLSGRVEFSGVTFRYAPGTAPALDQVSFEVPAGTIFGVVGRSGSGKTTVTRLIQGLYSAEEGIIRLDGLDVREIDLVHLRSSIGVVLQDNFLFRGTVRENIAATKPDASFEQIVQAARLAGADEFIERLPRGFDTLLEENGANLSGGQKQRLAIARALLPRPRILILDEATSALDPDSEAIIQKNLKAIAKGRTLIVVSHRLSTLTESDRILVLERGRVEALGTHADLLTSSPSYAHLWQAQTRHMG